MSTAQATRSRVPPLLLMCLRLPSEPCNSSSQSILLGESLHRGGCAQLQSMESQESDRTERLNAHAHTHTHSREQRCASLLPPVPGRSSRSSHFPARVCFHSQLTLLICLHLPLDCKLHVVSAWVVVIFPIPIPTPPPFFLTFKTF